MATLGKFICALAASAGSAVPVTSFRQLCCRGEEALLSCITSPWQQSQQLRGRYVDWKMLRDVKRRRLVKEHGVERHRINTLRKNNILPRDLRDIASKEIAAFPRDAHPTRIVNRCVITSRPRAVQERWRVSRIVWRHLADYNKLSGVTRAWW